jgi:hypothetical protein
MSLQAVESYLSDGFSHIEGWVSPHFLRVVGHFGEEMNRIGVTGGACEIGVHKGKFIVGLLCAVDYRPSLAIDIFNMQELNIDNSGGGQNDLLEQFSSNVDRFGSGKIKAIVADSLSLSAAHQSNILQEFGSFQFFSVDGGHEPEHLVNDYRFAEAVTHPGGAIIIDDMLNPGWPGVMEGVASLFLLDRPKFVPFAIGYNKLILVGLSYHQRYFQIMRKRLEENMPETTIWVKKFFGHDVIVLL